MIKKVPYALAAMSLIPLWTGDIAFAAYMLIAAVFVKLEISDE